MGTAVDSLADLLFPRQCSHCDTWDNGWLCPACTSQIEFIASTSMHDLRSFSGVRALTQYTGIVKDVLHRTKYEDQPWRLIRFTSAVIENEPDVTWLDDIDLVVPMPGDPWRTWKRGFNPARLIAKEIVRTSKRPLAHPRWFTRTGSKPQQALSMDERSKRYEENVFRLDKRYFGQAERVKCLLVDDIATTGATLRAATAALTASGLTVEALVLSVGL